MDGRKVKKIGWMEKEKIKEEKEKLISANIH